MSISGLNRNVGVAAFRVTRSWYPLQVLTILSLSLQHA